MDKYSHRAYGRGSRASSLAACLLCLVACLSVGAAVRVAYNDVTVNATPIQADAKNYIHYADNLLLHGTFSKDSRNNPPVPDAYWAPGYPVFLASIAYVADAGGFDRYTSVLNAQVALGLLTIVLTLLLSARVLPGFWPVLPGLLLALSPHHVAIGQNLLTETLFGFLLLLSLYLFVLANERISRALFLASGFSFALTWLTNPVSLFLVPVLALSMIWDRDQISDRMTAGLCTGLLLMPLVLVLLCWNVRTAIVVPQDSPSASDRLLTNMIVGLHEDFFQRWRIAKRDPTNPAIMDQRRINGDWSEFKVVAFERIADDPVAMLRWYVLDKPRLLWSWSIQYGFRDIYVYPIRDSLYDRSGIASATYGLMRNLHQPLLLLMLLSVVFLFSENKHRQFSLSPVYFALIVVSGVYVVSLAEPRYSIPIRPLMYLAASYALLRIVRLCAQGFRRFGGPRPAV